MKIAVTGKNLNFLGSMINAGYRTVWFGGQEALMVSWEDKDQCWRRQEGRWEETAAIAEWKREMTTARGKLEASLSEKTRSAASVSEEDLKRLRSLGYVR